MRYITLLFSVAMLMLCAACNKDKNCRCTVKSVDSHKTVTSKEVVIGTDSGVKCSDITVVGDEWMSREGYTSSRNTVSCEEE